MSKRAPRLTRKQRKALRRQALAGAAARPVRPIVRIEGGILIVDEVFDFTFDPPPPPFDPLSIALAIRQTFRSAALAMDAFTRWLRLVR